MTGGLCSFGFDNGLQPLLRLIHNLIRGGVHRRLRESDSLSNLSAASIRIESNSNRILGYVDATIQDVLVTPSGNTHLQA